MLPQKQGNLFVVASKLFKFFLRLKIFLIVQKPKSGVIHDFLNIRQIVRRFVKLFISDYLIHSAVEVLVLLVDFVELRLLALSVLQELLDFLVPLFTDVHDDLFLPLMVVKGLLGSLCVNFAGVRGIHRGICHAHPP